MKINYLTRKYGLYEVEIEYTINSWLGLRQKTQTGVLRGENGIDWFLADGRRLKPSMEAELCTELVTTDFWKKLHKAQA